MRLFSHLGTLDTLAERTLDKITDWALVHGVEVLGTLVAAVVALKLSMTLIDGVDRAIAHSTVPETNARRAQRTRTLTTILRSTTRTAILFATLLTLFSAMGINITPILASAGVVGLAVGFGAQSLVKDVIAGFFILFEDQFGVGDSVDIDGKSGMVEKMNLRITQLRNLAGELITIPNGTIRIVSNTSNEWSRAVLEIAVPYETDLDRALELIVEAGMSLRLERPTEALEEPQPLGVHAFGESSVSLRAIMKTGPIDRGPIAAEWRRRVKVAFDRAGIPIAVPQRVLRIVSETRPDIDFNPAG